MRKFINKTMASVLALATAFSLVACGGGGDELDETKATLNIGVFNAGNGTMWAEESIDDFEEFYKNTQFGDKVGVQVVMDAKKDQFTPKNLIANMEYYSNAIYFLNQSNYQQYQAAGLLADMTDTIKEKVYDDNGDLAAATGKPATKSILDTMKTQFVGQHEIAGKYYGIPWLQNVSGIIYDADLFNEEGLYYDSDNQLGATQADIDAGTAGVGPDLEAGTADDGLPRTWSEFKELCAEMKNNRGIIPFTWSGNTSYQRNYIYHLAWMNYQGYDEYMKNYTLEGCYTADGQRDMAAITALANQEGRKAGIQAMRDIFDNGWYDDKALTQEFQSAQTRYIDSVNSQSGRIAFFPEGGYWEAEAIATFDFAAQTNPEMGYGKRDFRYLAIPSFDGEVNPKATGKGSEVLYGSEANSLICITAKNSCENPQQQLELAKLFLQFVQSREQLSKSTKNMGACFRSYNFTATKEEIAGWTKYAQSVYKYIDVKLPFRYKFFLPLLHCS